MHVVTRTVGESPSLDSAAGEIQPQRRGIQPTPITAALNLGKTNLPEDGHDNRWPFLVIQWNSGSMPRALDSNSVERPEVAPYFTAFLFRPEI